MSYDADLGVTILVYINRHLNVYLKDSTNDRLNSWKYTIPVWTHSGKSEYKEDTTLKECIQIIIKYIDDFLNSGLDMIEYRRSCEKVKVALEILGIIFPALGWH